MTNEECVLQLEYLKDFKTPQQVEALDFAIKALEDKGYDQGYEDGVDVGYTRGYTEAMSDLYERGENE